MNKEVTEKEITEDLKISKHVFKTFFAGYQYLKEDLIQEGVLALMKARKSFDNTKGVYSTFAFKVATNAMRMYLRKEYRYEDVENIEDYAFEIADEINDIDISIHIKNSIVDVIENSKNPRVIEKIVNLLGCGFTGIEIAESLNFSRTYVSKLINDFRKRLRKELINC